MATEKQIEANRRNAQKSTGPKSEAGKEASRYNAVIHGLRASSLALPHEDTEEVQAFVDGLINALGPRDAVEAELAAEIATLSWKLRRAERYEHAYLSRRMMAMQDTLAGPDEDTTDWNITCASFDDDAAGQRRRRYLSGIRRSLDRARRDFARWRAEHPAETVEPETPSTEPAPGPTHAETEPRSWQAAPPEIGFVRPEPVAAARPPRPVTPIPAPRPPRPAIASGARR